MEPILCPNGHPNRPGTRICAVCRALIAPPPAAPAAPTPAAPSRAALLAASTSARPEQAAPARPVASERGGAGCWLLGALLLLLSAAVAIMAVYVFLFPVRRGAEYLATAAIVTLPAAGLTSPALPGASSDPTRPPSSTPPPSPSAAPVTAAGASPTAVATITPLSTIVGVVLTPTTALPAGETAAGANLIQNGDFAADWANGWERQTAGLNASRVVEGRTLAGEPPLPTLHLGQWGAGSLRVVQHVTLAQAAADLSFRGRVRLAGLVDPAGVEGRAALVLLYEDAGGQPLGASIWLDGSADAFSLWNSALPSLGPAIAPRTLAAGWQVVELDLGREFAERLPGITPDAVRRITVLLTVAGSDGCRPDACPAELDAAGLSLAASQPAN